MECDYGCVTGFADGPHRGDRTDGMIVLAAVGCMGLRFGAGCRFKAPYLLTRPSLDGIGHRPLRNRSSCPSPSVSAKGSTKRYQGMGGRTDETPPPFCVSNRLAGCAWKIM